MAETKSTAAQANGTQSKAALQRELKKTRESMAETVEDIRETVVGQYEAVKETVGGVLDFREQFKDEPLVWSLGALSAGFALGYTTGYAHKEMQAKGKHSEVSAFTNSLVTDLSAVGQTMVMPTLNLKIKELFGFDFSDLLAHMNQAQSSTQIKKKSGPKSRTKKPAARTRKKAATKPKR